MPANPHRGHGPLLQAKHHISLNRTLFGLALVRNGYNAAPMGPSALHSG